ncbi:MAG TPA: hypothetical protein PKA44_10695 [Saprospiraceae bacterium]|nr:hypothetical protein [Saprospiraceae bacterium]
MERVVKEIRKPATIIVLAEVEQTVVNSTFGSLLSICKYVGLTLSKCLTIANM